MKPGHFKTRPAFQTGFSLVEIMIGLVIGMLVSVVIVQVMSSFENQKNTTTGTADAQINGSIAMYNIQRELQMGGYPLMPIQNSPLECANLTVDGVVDPANPNPTGLSPVIITDGGPGLSDTLLIRYGDAPSGGIFNEIKQFPSAITGGANANDVTLDNNLGCAPGSRTLIINGISCSLATASAVPATGALTSGVASAITKTVTLSNITNAAIGANMACLGTWNVITYRINANNLERRNTVDSPNFVPVMTDIVNMQAQYGISAFPTSNQINQWVDATGVWAAPSLTNRNRIKAIRLAIVARNSKREPAAVTNGCSAAAPNGPCSWADSASSPAPAITLANDADGTSWQNYRYRVFETIIPLRNMIWARGTL